MTTVLADYDTYGVTETNKAAIKQDYITHECRLYNLH